MTTDDIYLSEISVEKSCRVVINNQEAWNIFRNLTPHGSYSVSIKKTRIDYWLNSKDAHPVLKHIANDVNEQLKLHNETVENMDFVTFVKNKDLI